MRCFVKCKYDFHGIQALPRKHRSSSLMNGEFIKEQYTVEETKKKKKKKKILFKNFKKTKGNIPICLNPLCIPLIFPPVHGYNAIVLIPAANYWMCYKHIILIVNWNPSQFLCEYVADKSHKSFESQILKL